MVHFNPKGYTITVETSDPVEDWMEFQSEIIRVLVALDSVSDGMYWPTHLFNFLRDMQPDIEVAKKMVKPGV